MNAEARFGKCVHDLHQLIDDDEARRDIINLSQQAESEDINEDNFINLLESHSKPLSNKELMELD